MPKLIYEHQSGVPIEDSIANHEAMESEISQHNREVHLTDPAVARSVYVVAEIFAYESLTAAIFMQRNQGKSFPEIVTALNKSRNAGLTEDAAKMRITRLKQKFTDLT